MIPAYHIVGFKSIELGRYAYNPTPAKKSDVEAVYRRYDSAALAQQRAVVRCHGGE
jgi:hypothetical protein